MEQFFYFVSDQILKKQLAHSLSYTVELEGLAKESKEPNRSTFNKTIVIYLASVIEAVLHFFILESGFTHYQKDWSYQEIKLLHKVDENQQIIAGKRIRKQGKIKGYMDFGVLNKFCKNQAKLYKDDVYKQVNRCRELRNKIHLMKINELDEKFSAKTVESVAKTLLIVLEIVEKKLKPKK